MTPPSALVLEGRDVRTALAVVRALGRAGWRVGIASPGDPAGAHRSRWCTRRHEAPSVHDDRDGFLKAVPRAAAEGGYALAMPCGDAELLAVSADRERLGLLVPYPDHANVLRALDKLELTSAATRNGLAVPGTWTEPPDLPEVVVKPRLHVSSTAGWWGETRRVAGREAARRAGDEIRTAGGEPIFQEPVAGGLMALGLVLDRTGQVRAVVQQETEHTWPVGLGPSARAHTVRVDGGLLERARALLRDLGWHGLAQLQFLRGDDGIARLIDLNARPYGSLALAVGAGANLAAAWGDVVLDQDRAPVSGTPGRRFQVLRHDLRVALATTRGPVPRARRIAQTLAYAPGAVHPTFDRRDPVPEVALVVSTFRRRLPR